MIIWIAITLGFVMSFALGWAWGSAWQEKRDLDRFGSNAVRRAFGEARPTILTMTRIHRLAHGWEDEMTKDVPWVFDLKQFVAWCRQMLKDNPDPSSQTFYTQLARDIEAKLPR